jgi:hypothetical protein
MIEFGNEERRILRLMSVGNRFILKSKEYIITTSGKPTCRLGEPKTDFYVKAETYSGESIEIKVTYKMEAADFLENKVNACRAEHLLGSNWQSIIKESNMRIFERFKSRPLIYKRNFGRTEEGSITLGWKYELLNKISGELSGELVLNKEQVMDVYAGTNLSVEKRNAQVNGQTIVDSGVANYILIKDNLCSTQSIIDNLILVSEYVDRNPKIYFACKALNYRIMKNKWDGDRPLAVFVDWSIKNGRLTSELNLNHPLTIKGHEVAANLIDLLNHLGITSTEDIVESNIDSNVKVF